MTTSLLLPMELPHIDAAIRDAGSESAEARWVAAIALGREDGSSRKEVIDSLVRLAGDPVDEVKIQALEGLAEQARGQVSVPADVVAESLGSRSASVRSKAVEVCVSILEDPIPAIVPLATDEEPGVRAAVASALGDLRAGSESEVLAALLEDQDREVRIEAAMSLASFGDARGEPTLLDALERDRDLAFDIAVAIGLSGSRSAAKALTRSAGKMFSSAEFKAIAAAAAARCGLEEGKKDLEDMLSSRRRHKRIAAIQALCSLPVGGMAPSVGRLIGEGREEESSSAIRALLAIAEVDCDSASAELERLRQSGTPEIRVEIEEALELLGSDV